MSFPPTMSVEGLRLSFGSGGIVICHFLGLSVQGLRFVISPVSVSRGIVVVISPVFVSAEIATCHFPCLCLLVEKLRLVISPPFGRGEIAACHFHCLC